MIVAGRGLLPRAWHFPQLRLFYGYAVGTTVSDNTMLAVMVAVAEIVGVHVGDGVSVGVDVAVIVGVSVGVALGVGVNVAVEVGVNVGVAVAVEVDVAVGVKVGVGVCVGGSNESNASTRISCTVKATSRCSWMAISS